MMTVLVAGLFGHRAPSTPFYLTWWHHVLTWMAGNWQVLAVVIPVAGGVLAGVLNHYLAVSRENRTRRLTRKDLRTRVHADLAARLLAHCSEVQHAYRSNAIDETKWRRGNDNLRQRAENSDLIDVLGPRYVSFMAAIERERRILEGLEANSKTRDGVREVMRLYAPFIAEFGEPKQAKRLRRT